MQLTQRRVLKSQIIKAWQRAVKLDYCSQKINSERSLQASLWGHLYKTLTKGRKIFIEPQISIITETGVKRIIPDIVICNSKEVIGIIEIKYLPRAQPKFDKDIHSLSTLAKHRENILLSHERFRGKPTQGIKYKMSKYILFIWAGIHASGKISTTASNQTFADGVKELAGCYLELHAETSNQRNPKVFKKSI